MRAGHGEETEAQGGIYKPLGRAELVCEARSV